MCVCKYSNAVRAINWHRKSPFPLQEEHVTYDSRQQGQKRQALTGPPGSQASLPGTCIFWGCWSFLPVPDGFLSGRAWACRGWAGQERVSCSSSWGSITPEGASRRSAARVCTCCVCASRVCACVVHVSACAAHVTVCRACICVCAACMHVPCTSPCVLHVCVLHMSVHVLGTCLCSGGQTHAHTLLLHIFPDITLLL